MIRFISHSLNLQISEAKARGNHIDQMLVYLSGNDLKLACETAQARGDHYAVLIASQNSGNNSCPGQLTLQQLERFTNNTD